MAVRFDGNVLQQLTFGHAAAQLALAGLDRRARALPADVVPQRSSDEVLSGHRLASLKSPVSNGGSGIRKNSDDFELASHWDSSECRNDKVDAQLQSLVSRLTAFADGTADDFLDIELDLDTMTGFQRRVIARCRRIAWGKTLTYGQLAACAGSPRAARAVGNIMAANRFPLIVPCHRVIGAGGSLRGFSAPDGLTMKRRLLQREGSLSR